MAFCRYGGNKMKSRLLIAAASAALMAAPTLASAHDDAGWYLRGLAGYGVHSCLLYTSDAADE